MKKVFVLVCMAAVMASLCSCAVTRRLASPADISGEWNIVEVNGTTVVPAPGQVFPYIGFSQEDSRLYGNSGCNRMMGSYRYSSENGELELGQIGSTRMMCEDMTLEKNVLSVLERVRKCVRLEDGSLALCASSAKYPLLVLQKREPMTLNELGGRWTVAEAGGHTIPTGMEKQPYLEIDVIQKKVHGTGGCNVLNGGFQTEEGQPQSIAFPTVVSTMMACPDLEVEGFVTKALNDTRSFGRTDSGDVAFYDESGAQVLLLVR